jgi:hypothetical protein
LLHVLDAIDRARSVFTSYPADYPRQDLVGQPMIFSKVVLSPEEISASVFRLVDWNMAIVVSEGMRDRIADAAIPDAVFSQVEAGDCKGP